MTASKVALTNQSFSRNPPTINQWMDIVDNIRSMEHLTFNLRLQKEKGDALGEKWDIPSMGRSDKLLLY